MMETPEPKAPRKTLVWIVYGLQFLAFAYGISSLVGFIMDLAMPREMKNHWLIASHRRWQIRTFLWSLLWGAVGSALLFTILFPLGGGILITASLWYLYRVIWGVTAFADDKPPKPGYC